MTIAKKLSDAYSFVKEKVVTSKYLDNASFTAFLVSLLPIPVLSQSASVLDRIASDQSTKNQFDAVWAAIASANARINDQEDSVERTQQIAATLQFNTAIAKQLNELLTGVIKSLAAESSEWEVLTKNWSFQAILNSLVDVDSASIAAINNSHNLVQNTRIHANKTQLLADNNSSNIVDKSSFHGPTGSVSMDAIRTQGHIQVQNDSVGFGENGCIGFGEGGMLAFGAPQPRPTSLMGTCSNCNHSFSVNVQGGIPSQIQCPRCKSVLQSK